MVTQSDSDFDKILDSIEDLKQLIVAYALYVKDVSVESIDHQTSSVGLHGAFEQKLVDRFHQVTVTVADNFMHDGEERCVIIPLSLIIEDRISALEMVLDAFDKEVPEAPVKKARADFDSLRRKMNHDFAAW